MAEKENMIAIKILLIVIEALCSFLLIGVILLQKSRGSGLGMAFGAETAESLFGARAGNVLIKATTWLGIIFLLNTPVLAKIYTHQQSHSLIDTYNTTPPIERQVPVNPVSIPYSESEHSSQPPKAPAEFPSQEPQPDS